ncbi:MAG: type I secretion C-terminal target domain-containing protein [Alphaproteobacteria bacterium]|nr:type I secretion C-terminal target domain-containing protein [Alphaproteobacteria bacterium]
MRFEDGMIQDLFAQSAKDDGVMTLSDVTHTELYLQANHLSSTYLAGIEPGSVSQSEDVAVDKKPSVFSKFSSVQEEENKNAALEKLEEVTAYQDEVDLDGDAEQKVEMLQLAEPVVPKTPSVFGRKPEQVEQEPIEIDEILQPEASKEYSFMNYAIEHGIDLIRDFDPEQGDILDFAKILGQFDPSQHMIEQFIMSRDVEGGVIVSVDPTGTADSTKAIDLIALENLHNLDLQAMYESGHINLF